MSHELSVLIAYVLMSLINAYTDMSSKDRGLKFDMRLQCILTLCMRAADSSEFSLVNDAIRTKISCIGPYLQ